MMTILFWILQFIFILSCFLLILLVLMQKGKGSMGIGNMGGGAQMLFGGSGGQDFFQKVTWVLGAIFMFGSLVLGLMKSSALHESRYAHMAPQREIPEIPTEAPSSETPAAQTGEQKTQSTAEEKPQ